MKIERSPECLTAVDNFCDYVPVISSASAILTVFLKCVVFPRKGITAGSDNHFFRHLHHKSFTRLAVISIPVIGNILIALFDVVTKKYSNKSNVLIEIENNRIKYYTYSYANISKELLDDVDVFRAIFKDSQNRYGYGYGLSYGLPYNEGMNLASERLRNTKELILEFVAQNPRVVKIASQRLQNDEDIKKMCELQTEIAELKFKRNRDSSMWIRDPNLDLKKELDENFKIFKGLIPSKLPVPPTALDLHARRMFTGYSNARSVMGLQQGQSIQRTLYHKTMRECHPDKNPKQTILADAVTKRLNIAKKILDNETSEITKRNEEAQRLIYLEESREALLRNFKIELGRA